MRTLVVEPAVSLWAGSRLASRAPAGERPYAREPPVPDQTPPDSAGAVAPPRPGTNPVIEQAKGILMARHGCTPDQAFELLRRASQRANIKLSALAAALAEQAASATRPDTSPSPV